jgi:hypothetical protein
MRAVRILLPLALGLTVAGLSLPEGASAQPRLVLGVGISNPAGDLGTEVESGYHGRVAVQLGVPVFPVSVRAEGGVHSFDAAGTSGGTMQQLDGAISAVISLGGIGIGPYFFGGMGKYRQDFSEEFARGDPVTRGGMHAGFGVNVGLLGFGGFAEVRIVDLDVDTDVGNNRFVPITVGVRF